MLEVEKESLEFTTGPINQPVASQVIYHPLIATITVVALDPFEKLLVFEG